MRNRILSTHVIALTLFSLACILGAWSQMRQMPQMEVPRARFDDKKPLGGKGLRLVLERLGYTVRRTDGVLQSMPRDAKVWILLDPHTRFTQREADLLLQWVTGGGTLLTAIPRAEPGGFSFSEAAGESAGRARIRNQLQIDIQSTSPFTPAKPNDEPLPTLTPLSQSSAGNYWSGVQKATGSADGLQMKRAHLEIAGTPVETQLARIDYGQGRVFVAPDALLFTNYALSKPDNAVLVTNLIRAHVSSGTVYFDERAHGEDLQSETKPNLLYYLWRPPLRYALLQLLVAGVLLWAFFGRRLGAPVPLPNGGPVTRASQFAAAMGALFAKVGRPRAAATIIGEDFRRQLTKRLGLSIADPDELIAQRASEATGYSSRVIDRLLLQAKSPDDDEARALSDAQEMETILRSLDRR